MNGLPMKSGCRVAGPSGRARAMACMKWGQRAADPLMPFLCWRDGGLVLSPVTIPNFTAHRTNRTTGIMPGSQRFQCLNRAIARRQKTL
jgi:hypothetical protein